MANQPFEIPAANTTLPVIFDSNNLPLNDQEASDLEGTSLARRGLKEEAEMVSRVVLRRPKVRGKAKIQKVDLVEKPETPPVAEVIGEKPIGRPRKRKAKNEPIVSADPETGTAHVRISVDYDFIREICEYERQLFGLIERLSSTNWKLVSPQNGGVDLEYGYALQERIIQSGLV